MLLKKLRIIIIADDNGVIEAKKDDNGVIEAKKDDSAFKNYLAFILASIFLCFFQSLFVYGKFTSFTRFSE
jgi:hypothetical protein